MKLYNLYKEIILEADDQEVNADNNMPCFGDYTKMSIDNIIDALIEGCEDANNNKFWYPANIWYNGESTPRYVFIHTKGRFKSGLGIRAWQTAGPSNSAGRVTHKGPPKKIQEKVGWRIFLIENINKIEPRNFKIYNPFDGYAGPDDDQKTVNGKTISGIRK